MIRRLKEGSALDRIEPISETAVRLLCMAQAYGTDRPFLPFWEGEDGLLLSLLDRTAHLLAGGTDLEELALFLAMQEEIGAVRTEGTVAEKLAEHLPGWQVKRGRVMTPDRVFSEEKEVFSPAAREVYPVLQACFGKTVPPFEVWYGDVSHRLRHGFCRLAAVVRDDRPVACAMTTAECRGGAVIGGVATLPEYRGQGFASACVSALTSQLQKEGRRIFLSPKNEAAQRLYTYLGYRVCGDWGTLSRRGE